MSEQQRVIAFDRLRMADVDKVGGKNASLGELIRALSPAGVRVRRGMSHADPRRRSPRHRRA